MNGTILCLVSAIVVLVAIVFAVIWISGRIGGKHHGAWSDLVPPEIAILEDHLKALEAKGPPPKAKPAGKPLFGGWPYKGIRIYPNGIWAPFTRMVVEDYHWSGWEYPVVSIFERWRFVPYELITGIYPIMIMRFRHVNEESTPWDLELGRSEHKGVQIETADMQVAVIKLKSKRGRQNSDQLAMTKALDKALGQYHRSLLETDVQLFGIEYVRALYKYYPAIDHRGDFTHDEPVETASAAHHLLDLHKHAVVRDMPHYRQTRIAQYRRRGIRRLERFSDDSRNW